MSKPYGQGVRKPHGNRRAQFAHRQNDDMHFQCILYCHSRLAPGPTSTGSQGSLEAFGPRWKKCPMARSVESFLRMPIVMMTTTRHHVHREDRRKARLCKTGGGSIAAGTADSAQALQIVARIRDVCDAEKMQSLTYRSQSKSR